MKRTRITALVMFALLTLISALPPGRALAAEKLLVATVTAAEEIAILAPHSGEIRPFTLEVGDQVSAGDTLFLIKPGEMLAQADGTVAVVHAGSGESASGAVSRYGAVLQIEHENRYELIISMRTGYNSVENRDLWVGTPVYLRSVNGEHFGLGTVISVTSGNMTVTVESGDLVYDEEVRAYRTEDYDAKALLGRAKPSLVPPHLVTAAGTILSMKVARGNKVKQGDLLFTYVPESLSPSERATKGAARATEALVISSVSALPGAQVQQGQTLARGLRASSMQLSAQAEEKDILSLVVGTEATVYFEELGLDPIPAKVSKVSALGTGDDIARYEVSFSLEAPAQVRFGMHATVQVP